MHLARAAPSQAPNPVQPRSVVNFDSPGVWKNFLSIGTFRLPVPLSPEIDCLPIIQAFNFPKGTTPILFGVLN